MSDDPKMEELDKLISTGKQKGYVTYEELNDALPGDLISSYQLDDIMLMFGAMDIDVVDTAKAPRPLNEIEDSLDEREETVQAEPGEAIDLSPGPIGRTEDPVRPMVPGERSIASPGSAWTVSSRSSRESSISFKGRGALALSTTSMSMAPNISMMSSSWYEEMRSPGRASFSSS